jgi:peptidoglycan/xylan/chitin deacetylase (PgdA/CDA1 family)
MPSIARRAALVAALLALSPALADERHALVGGVPITFQASAHHEKVKLPVALLVSSEARVLLATLLDRGWGFHLETPGAAAGEHAFTLNGKTPNVEFEHAGARIDERLKLFVWKLPHGVRGLPLWAIATAKLSGVRPLQPSQSLPQPSPEARDRVLADLSFSLSQTRQLASPGSTRLAWVEMVAAPEGAEDLVPEPQDVAGSGAHALEAVARAAQPDAGAPEPAPPAAIGGAVQSAEPKTPAHLAVVETVQSAVEGIEKLEPLPPPAAVSAVSISRPEKAGPRVALTFDACSTLDRSFYDERVMRVLRETKTPATLFISGRWAETHQSIVKDLANDDLFEIANHSYTHPHMLEMPVERQEHELLWTQQILLTLTGKLPRFFRPPYGEMNQPLVDLAATVGLRTVEFDFPSGDPDKNITKERMIKWVIAKARPGSIVVMHMNRHGWHTGEALPDIIAGLRKRGFTLSRVGDLVDADAAASAAK